MADQNYATVSGEKVDRSDFAYAPEGSGPSEWKLPVHDESHVRNALARFNQTDLPAAAKAEAKRKILARAHKYGIDTSGFEKEHGSSEKASDAPRFVLAMADIQLSESGAVRIPLAVTGSWVKGSKKFSITLEDLKNIARNFSKRLNGEVNADYEHASEQPEVARGGDVPSAGRIVAVEDPQEAGGGKHMLWGLFEPTDRARQMVRAKEYRYISPAIDWGAADKQTGEKQGATLTSIALTNRPFLEELPQLQLSDSSWKLMDSNVVHVPGNISSPQSAGQGGKVKTYKVKKLADGEHKGKHGVFDDGEMMGLAEVEPDADDKQKASEARVQVLSEIAPGRTLEEAKSLVERGATVDQEAKLLSEIVTDKGKIDTVKLDELTDSGRVKPSAQRRALEAETKAQAAFASGKIKAADLRAATRLALSDAEAFERFVASAPAAVQLNEQGLPGEGGSGSANLAWNQQLEKKASELLNAGKAKGPEQALQLAEHEMIHTEDGLKLYELARKERLEAERTRK